MPLANASDDALPDTARRVASLLRAQGHDNPIVMLPSSGKTSVEAAAGLGCLVAQIAKSIIFRRVDDDAPVLVVASGINRVDERKVAARVGHPRAVFNSSPPPLVKLTGAPMADVALRDAP
ncbi:hypothetical protein IHE32_11595 [Mycetohabitans rhizoxinica]